MITTKDVLKWLLSLLSPYKKHVVLALLALFVAASSWLLLGQGIKLTVDEGMNAEQLHKLNTAIGWVLAFTVLGCLATYFRFYLMTWLGERISADIRINVYNHLLSLPLPIQIFFWHLNRLRGIGGHFFLGDGCAS